MKSEKIKVIVVDDHPLVIEGLRTSLGEDDSIEVIKCFNNAADLFSSLKIIITNVIVLDVNLPDMNGVEVCKKITKKHPHIKIIGLSTYNNPSIVKQMIKNGAKGYLLKNVTSKELVTAIHQIHKGQSYFSGEIHTILADSIFNTNAIPKLTRREKEILILVSEGITTPQIAKKLVISPLTVETHRRNLIQKMGVTNAAQLVKIAIEQKLI
ncbi:response regulator transcription factor [Aurantibacter crassamenti]|uniref:response regulator transcription factor n=1 Tax=Aurantibacter crassamenti TaxID=1837375 RepID=UPI00193AC5E7|nr:response regulator transcription factor [Aurantibacter crassamenti]MBM1105601.1 response regulator transcription factor [Aurantibacter crassamenti]